MKIAVSVENAAGLDSVVCPHFGRAPFFVLVDVADDGTIVKVDSVANPYFGNHQPGQVPAFINSQRANVMLSGGMGAGAISYFGQYGIQVGTGAAGTVRDTVSAYLSGALRGGESCAHDEHHDCH